MHINPGQGYQETEARLVEKSLSAQPDGSKPIQFGYTARPIDLLEAFQQYNPNLTLSGLADYIRGLMPGPARPGCQDTSYIESSASLGKWLHLSGYQMCLSAETVVLYQGSEMVQVEGNTDGTRSCGNVLHKLRVIVWTKTKTSPTPVPTLPPEEVATPAAPVGLIECYVSVDVQEGVQPQPLTVWVDGKQDSPPIPTHSVSMYGGRDLVRVRGITYVNQLLHTPCNRAGAREFELRCWNQFLWHMDMNIARREYHYVDPQRRVIFNRKDPAIFPLPQGARVGMDGGPGPGQGPYGQTYGQTYPPQGRYGPQVPPPGYGGPNYGQGYPLQPQRYQVQHRSIGNFILDILVPIVLNRRGPICQIDPYGRRICH